MKHSKRIWCVREVASPETLVENLIMHDWYLCTAFRIDEYYWLNDAESDSGDRKYSVVKRLDLHKFLQVESLNFRRCDFVRSLTFIVRTLAGEFDPIKPTSKIFLTIEQPSQHGRCQYCA